MAKEQILGVISRKDAENFLVELANYESGDSESDAFNRFCKRWAKIFGDFEFEKTFEGVPREALMNGYLVRRLRPLLRRAWDAHNPREKEWFAHKVRERYNEDRVEAQYSELVRDASLREFGFGSGTTQEDLDRQKRAMAAKEQLRELKDALPPISMFDAALQHFSSILTRAHHCQNPVCHTPYFIADRNGQKFCSTPCSAPAQQAAKRKWWDTHGSEWRKTRKVKGGAKR
jgi:hypothetical protein